MATAASQSVLSGLGRASVGCAAIVAALAVLALVGWTLQIEALKRLGPGLAPIKANEAICYLLLSLSLVVVSYSAPARLGLRRGAAVCALVVVLVGAATLAEYAFGLRLGIDELLFRDRAGANALYPGRPAVTAAVGFVLLGGTLLLREVRLGRWWPSNVLAWAAGTLGLLVLTGYVTGAAALVAIPRHQALALSSAVALSVLSLAVLLARPGSGWVAGLASDGQTGVIIRRLVGPAIALPVGLATLTLVAQRLHVFSTVAGVWLFVSAVTLAVITVAWLAAAAAVRANRTRWQAAQTTARLAAIVDSSDDAIIGKTLEGRITSWNRAAERIYGYSAVETVGDHISMLTPTGDRHEIGGLLARVASGERVRHFETVRRRKDGQLIDMSLTVSPIRDATARIIGASTVARDVTERKLGERARARALVDLEEAQRLARLGSWTWDPRADEMTWSAQMYEIYGRDPMLGPASREEALEYVHPDDRERVAVAFTQAFGGGPAVELDHDIIAGRGVQRTLHVLAHPDPARAGCYLGTVQDVTELRAVELALRDAEERFRRAFDEAPIGMALISADGFLQQANASLGVICARTRSELHGINLRELLHPADADTCSQALRALAAGEIEQLAAELRIIPAAGSALDTSVHGTRLRCDDGRPVQLLCQFQDVTERKRFETQLQFMADHDPLTGLLNRRKFEAELDRHIAHVKRYGSGGALLVLDIDHFKIVNDTLGHNAGDELIVSIASVLGQRLRQSDVLARLGGDEFAVLLPEADPSDAAQVAETLVSAVRMNTALLGGERKKVTTSIGVTMFDANSEELSSETALIEADLAMYDAKEAGRDGHAFYATSEHRTSRTKARLTWVGRIEQALESDRFALVAQPILDLHAGQVRQHELLLRMLDEHDDLVPPAAFLYIAERFGLIGKLDEWVVTQAIELIEQHPELQLEVNISGRSLGDQRLLAAIDQCLRESQIDPTHLIFEVTETAAVANLTHAQAFARHLRDHGCRFALDDFGAGFGSFYYLKHLPFDYVKIDGEFVQHATAGGIDQLVIQAVVGIAQGLGKETIAEFVVNERTQRMVARLGVDYAQGYHIGKPVPIPDLLRQQPLRPRTPTEGSRMIWP